MATSAEVLI